MKKIIISMCAAASFAAFADSTDEVKKEQTKRPGATESELEADQPPRFWGFASYGLYSGYQLYGSLLNNEPTLQGYLEGNMNLNWDDVDLGFLGAGIWSNTDLTRRRSGSYSNTQLNSDAIGDVFNEWDFNIHWQKTFWFDDDKSWGLTYRSYVVWYYYPGKFYSRIQPGTDTTFDWDHYFELTNPYLTPYVNWVHEYLQSNGNVYQFGVKKPIQVTDSLSLCPFLECVARDGNYNWCFPTRFGDITGDGASRGWTCGSLATIKVELDANYQITKHFGLFAKVAYCSIIDHHMRNTCDDYLASDEYGENKDFCWGGVGISVNF